jgi:hypothetical protein
VKDLWWDEAFLEYNYGSKNIAAVESLVLPFQVFPKLLRVGFIGPYSLAYTSDMPVNLDALRKIWIDVLEKFQDSELQVRLPPESFYPELFSANYEVLSQLGARVLYRDINFHLNLNGNFRDSINRNRSRELKRASRRNYLLKETTLADAFKVILLNRLEKGLKPSLSMQQLFELHELFPNRIRFYGVEVEGRIVSAAITLIINSVLVYVFMWGHDPSQPTSAESISTLCEGLFNTFKGEGFQFLCLGTASIQGVMDEGLSMYKASLGAIPSDRVTVGSIREKTIR